MPYADPDKQREYQRRWMARRRKQWFQENGPCEECGSWNNLELDHRDPAQKVTHKVWSWAKSRRDAELAKCRALCSTCHADKSAQEMPRGAQNGKSIFTAEDVREIRRLHEEGNRQVDIAKSYGVDRRTIWDVIHKSWQWL